MYKNLNPLILGVSGRQSEIIELALTYGFKSFNMDVQRFLKKAEKKGVDQASRFIRSAKIKVGGFELPVRWRADEAIYRSDLADFESQAEILAGAGASIAEVTVLPASDQLPYHENFELHRQRLGEMAGILDRHGISMSVGFLAAPAHREDRAHQFISEAEALLTLIKSIDGQNVGLLLDVWNWHFGGGTQETLSGVDQIVSATLADAPADAEPATITEQQRQLPSEEGVIDHVGYLRLLNERGFDGPVTALPSPKAFTGMTREAIVQKIGAVLDQLWKEAEIIKPKSAPALAES